MKSLPDILLEQALKYHSLGMAVHPLGFGGKGPLIEEWDEPPKLTADDLQLCFEKRGDIITGLGFCGGSMSNGLCVLDFDADWQNSLEHFLHSWSELADTGLWSTAHVRRQLGLYLPGLPDTQTVTKFKRNGAIIELRCNGSNNALPNSFHARCNQPYCHGDSYYEWVSDADNIEFGEVDFDDLFGWLSDWGEIIEDAKEPIPERPVEIGDIDRMVVSQELPRAIETVKRMIRNAQDGCKHSTLLRASNLLGGYVGVGVIERQRAFDLLESAISQKPDVISMDAARDTISNGLEWGKVRPFTAEKILTDKVEYAKQQEQVVIPASSNSGTEPAEAAEPQITFRPWVWSEFLSRPPKQWFYPNYIGPGDIAVLAGDSGCGKTALALEFTMCGLLGKQFAGQFEAARPLKIAYCTAEGIGNLPARIKAAQEQHNVPLDVLERQFFGYDGPIVPQFFLSPESEYSIEQFERDLQALYIEPDILIVDTIALAASGGNLEDNGDVTFIMHRARQFTNRTNIAVKFNHHNNREGAFRGAASLRDNSDALFVVRFDRDKDERRLVCKGEKWAKLKDGEEWRGRLYELEPHPTHPAPIVNWLGEYVPNSGSGLVFKDELKDVMPFGEKWTVQEIKGALGDFFAPSTITNNINKLYKAGELSREVDNPAEKSSKKNPYKYWWTAKALL